MANHTEFDPGELERQDIYRLLTGSVVPRPIGWASTVSPSGVHNLAPFSFFTVVCIAPPMVTLTIARNPDGSKKHTLKNAEDTGEFCVNVVDVANWEQM
ncbi:MAG: flavin reductase family protein, partial [Nitrospinaceae bacterium]|nr:flavin reductase family protein [Nitrospinaceae bacterium]